MNKFTPIFYVENRAGQYLRKNPRHGERHQLPTSWTWRRDEAETFALWLPADQFRQLCGAKTRIVDQLGDAWTAQRATREHLFTNSVPAGIN